MLGWWCSYAKNARMGWETVESVVRERHRSRRRTTGNPLYSVIRSDLYLLLGRSSHLVRLSLALKLRKPCPSTVPRFRGSG